MDRRTFLWYAAAGVAMVGSALAGCELQTMSSTRPTPTLRELTTTSASSMTSNSVAQLSSLEGRLFFDYNGNGVQDAEEPAVSGALVQLKDNVGGVVAEALTDSSGDYRFEDIRAGSYELHVEADKRFRYMWRSPDELRSVADDYDVTLSGSSEISIGLAEGFLTMPFRFSDGKKIGRIQGFDHDPREGHVRDYLGNTNGIEDQHLGWDYWVPAGTPIVASAPGIALRQEGVNPNYPELGKCLQVAVNHGYPRTRFGTGYAHIRSFLINDGDFVERGQVIALSGSTCTTVEHLHFQLYDFDLKEFVDPFRDELDHNAVGYWTKDNDPQYSAV